MENDFLTDVEKKIETLKDEFAKVLKEIETLTNQATEKRTRLVEIQGAIKALSELTKKPEEK